MLIIIGISLFVIALIIVLYFISLIPNVSRGDQFRPFEDRYIAHRGFFDNEGDCPENSLAAFARAIEGNYGIELDVQLTADKKLVVFHDDDLFRMCGVKRNIADCTFDELQQYCLSKSNKHIPLFTDVLKLIDGKTPLIVEIKNSELWIETTKATAGILDEYKGCYCVESFNPLIVEWYKNNRPEILRGQLSTNFFKDEPQMSFFKKLILTNLLLNVRAKPDFIAYNHIHKNQFSYKLLRKIYPIKNVAWTVKSQEELNNAGDVFTCMIFDSFSPAKAEKTM